MHRGEKLRLFVAEERRVCREGICALLRVDEAVDVVGEAGDWRETVAVTGQVQPDVALVSATLPGMSCIQALSNLRQSAPKCRAILCGPTEDMEIVMAVKNGAKGYLHENSRVADMLKAIHAVHGGELWVERRILASCFDEEVDGGLAEDPALPRNGHTLTIREGEVLSLLASGATNKHIARILDISEKTVKSHLNNIFRKLGVSRRSQAIVCAMEEGLVDHVRPEFRMSTDWRHLN